MPSSDTLPFAFAALLLLSSCGLPGPPQQESDATIVAMPGLDRPVSYEQDVKPVLDSRCVVCHACYDAPCQLLLSSSEGTRRGASKHAVYDSSRLSTMMPTRLGIDAPDVEAWRAKGFFSVLDGSEPGASLLLRMLALGAAHPPAAGQRLPDDVPLDVGRELSCADASEFDDYARQHPRGGMPYGTAPLGSEELRVLASWLGQGAAAPSKASVPLTSDADVEIWEAFLNGPSLKERVVGRYLYEHWFVAHLVFEGRPTGPFFRLLRSRTAPGQPIVEIPTARPYDDPGAPFWYRLRPIDETIVHKTHIVYTLGPTRQARLRQLFLDTDWQPTELPSYAPAKASNPFVTFAEMPARSRYQFLLDDAQYFVMTFIRGPVCRGQVAVDVIEDQFWIAFLDPDRDLSTTNPAFLRETAALLDLPAEHTGGFLPGELWLEYGVKQRKYLDVREGYYDAIDPQRRGPALDWVWDGDGWNRNALLSVFRNFDNASVVKGFLGEIPKTAWLMDYPIFERIYYDLVAGYDVFGDLGHQVATRLYMDHLRMQSENLFLGFLPADRREALRASWYVGATRSVDYQRVDRLHGLDHGTQVRFTSTDPKAELLQQLLARSAAVAGPPDPLNRCVQPPCDRTDATPSERAAERELQRLASLKGAWVSLLPELSFVRVRVSDSGTQDLVYSLVHNAAHTNVAFMFDEEKRRVPADDTLTLVPGHFGSYPNFFFEVEADQLAAFVDGMRGLSTDADLERFSGRYGVRRTDPRFWATSDWLRDDLRRRSPTEFGLYDLGRYDNL
jgi:hypothetical protein